MPGFHEMNARQRAQMLAGHSLVTYSIMDRARHDPVPYADLEKAHGARDIEAVVEAGWIEIDDGEVRLTDEGIDHLRKF